MNVGFAGYSQGGWIINECLKLYPETDFLISVSGTVHTPLEPPLKTLTGHFISNSIRRFATSGELQNLRSYLV